MFRADVSGKPASSHDNEKPSNKESRPAPGSAARYLSRMDRFGTWAAKIRGSPPNSESAAERMFTALDEYIAGQLQTIANQIWTWRKSKVEKWEAILDSDPNNVINEARTVANGDSNGD